MWTCDQCDILHLQRVVGVFGSPHGVPVLKGFMLRDPMPAQEPLRNQVAQDFKCNSFVDLVIV